MLLYFFIYIDYFLLINYNIMIELTFLLNGLKSFIFLLNNLKFTEIILKAARGSAASSIITTPLAYPPGGRTSRLPPQPQRSHKRNPWPKGCG